MQSNIHTFGINVFLDTIQLFGAGQVAYDGDLLELFCWKHLPTPGRSKIHESGVFCLENQNNELK